MWHPTNRTAFYVCRSYQVKKSLTPCIFWALQLLGSLQILHIANPDNPETPYMTGKRLRRITALKYLSTIYPLQISEQPRHICSSGHWEGPQIPHKKNGNASESIRAHDTLTTSGLQRPNKNNPHFFIGSYSPRVPKPWSTKGCSSQRQGTGSRTPITFRRPKCLAVSYGVTPCSTQLEVQRPGVDGCGAEFGPPNPDR